MPDIEVVLVPKSFEIPALEASPTTAGNGADLWERMLGDVHLWHISATQGWLSIRTQNGDSY